MGLSSDNYATRTAPAWDISCHSGVHTGKALFVLYLCSSLQICVSEHHEPLPAAPQHPALPSHPFWEAPNVTFLLCPVLLSSHPPAEQLLLEQM